MPRAGLQGGEEKTRAGLLTVEEVATLLHVPVSWVYGRMRKRSLERLPAYRLGKYWRFREEEIDAWVASRVSLREYRSTPRTLMTVAAATTRAAIRSHRWTARSL